MSGHVRYRHCGGSIVAPVEDKKPFRFADLSPREQIAEAVADLNAAKHALVLKQADALDDPEAKKDFPRLEAEVRRLKQKVHELDFVYNDSATQPQMVPAPAPITLADINKRNATFWESKI